MLMFPCFLFLLLLLFLLFCGLPQKEHADGREERMKIPFFLRGNKGMRCVLCWLTDGCAGSRGFVHTMRHSFASRPWLWGNIYLVLLLLIHSLVVLFQFKNLWCTFLSLNCYVASWWRFRVNFVSLFDSLCPHSQFFFDWQTSFSVYLISGCTLCVSQQCGFFFK